ncbi:glyoxylate dehydrogenase [Rhodocollybia butyracea]|uniref:L-lactate dehydrogenase (cytochrome) n=1 Tax=Rhodocollybia butyracea TaxID=206335 RepID=A0A9P5UB35_9AGAR|nr:glyoxylate dehydrogenase [Rhodocollybia butyracea]
MLSSQAISEHSSRDSCWIIVHEHPGGSKIILKYAGKDATEAYEPIHPPNAIIDNLPIEKHLGVVDPSTVTAVVKTVSEAEKKRQVLVANRPHSMKSSIYMISRVWFRPRILRDVTVVDWSTTILGQRSSLPVYISATALGKLGHPDGELNLTRAAGKHGVIQMIPTLASCSFDEIVDAAQPGQPMFLQLYVNRDRNITKKYVQNAEKRGVKGLFITVDAPQLGRREKDMRMKFVGDDDTAAAKVQEGMEGVKKDEGVARAISSFIDPSLSWKDIPWFQSITNMPIILKGVATPEDAILALEHGVQGIVLSNHGGRQLDTARSGLENLIDIVAALKTRGPWPNPKFSVFVDGGVRRASDVLKALALGATAVGIGRGFLYAFCSYGQEGVEKAFKIIGDELEMNMRLLGARNLGELVPEMVDASALRSHAGTVPKDNLYNSTYQPLRLAEFRNTAKL